MSKTDLLNAVSLSLRRDPKVRFFRLDELKLPDPPGRHDPIFHKRYVAYLEGKLSAFATRLSLARVREGFYEYVRPVGFEYRCDQPPDQAVDETRRMIRQGYRPELFVYRNVNGGDTADYVCPDDVAVHRAYRTLGIAKVPAIILGNRQGLEESAIELRTYRLSQDQAPSHIHGFHPLPRKSVPAFVPDTSAESLASGIDRLLREVAAAKGRVKSFHTTGGLGLHYHHTLYSILYRMDEALRAIQMLVGNGMSYQAVPVLRAMYESAVNFYLDWLHPHVIHRFLSLSAAMSAAELKVFIEGEPAADGAGRGVNDPRVSASLKRTFALVRNVRAKADMSPLGGVFYEKLYGFLSEIVHQDFQTVAAFAHTLDVEAPAELEQETISWLLRCVDIIVATVVVCISEDVGPGQPELDQSGPASAAQNAS